MIKDTPRASIMEKLDHTERYEVSKNNGTKIAGWSKRDEHLAYAEISLLGIIFIAATIGNFILILVLWNRKKEAVSVLPQLIWDITDVFIGPDPLCRIIKYLQLVGMFASTYTVSSSMLPNGDISEEASSVELCNLHKLAFIFSKTKIAPGIFECWAHFIEPWGLVAYVTWISIAIFRIPVVILSICQIKICWEIKMNVFVKKHRKFLAHESQTGVMSRVSSVHCVSKAMIKNVRMTVVTVVSYVTCWTPFFIVQMWAAWSADALDGQISASAPERDAGSDEATGVPHRKKTGGAGPGPATSIGPDRPP
ncbi:unnamed protein product, partial [Ranitomeya imitator]